MHEEHHHAAPASVWDRRRIGARSLRRSSAAGSKPCKYRRRSPETVAQPHKRQSPYQLPQSHAHASPENMACPSQPPCRFDTKVESQIQPGEKPADSVNPENALDCAPCPPMECSGRVPAPPAIEAGEGPKDK